MARVDLMINLRADGVSVLLDLTDGRLPAIVHWGGDLGPLDLESAEALVLSGVAPRAPNIQDEPVRLAVLPEHWTGWSGRPGLSGDHGGRDWSPKFETTQVRIDGSGVPETPGRQLIEAGPASVQVDATDPVAQLGCRLTLELMTGGVLRGRAEITNLADEAYAVHDCVLAFPVPNVARELLDLAGHWGKERVPQRRPLVTGTHLREGRKGRTGPDAATMLHLGEPGFGFGRGEIWAVHAGWSGNHTHYAERISTGEQVIGAGELLLPGEMILSQGEAYTTPWVYGSHGRGLDEVARRFHRYLRARPGHPSADRPVTLNVWEAVYFDHRLGPLMVLAERAAAVGVERYVLDDGWFGARRDEYAGLGDWTVSPDVWPDGLHPLVDKVVGLGMQFGLWFEPEMINFDSDTARAHPEWIMATGDRWPIPSRHQQVINLGIPECYDYIRDALLSLLDEYKISYIKWDHNRDLIDAGTAPSGRPGVHEQTLAFYRLLAELKAAYPGLEIESCSSGGARVDLGVLAHADRIWVSDCIDPLDRQQMNRWTAQLVPPELMGSHIASGQSHTTGRNHTLAFRAVTAVFGHLGVEWDLAAATEDELTDLAAWIAFFKDHRPLLLGGDLVRTDLPDESVQVQGVVAPDRSTAIFSVASLAQPDVTHWGRLRLPGLDPDRVYRVRPRVVGTPAPGLWPPPWWSAVDGLELTGAALAQVGVMAPVLFPEQGFLIMIESADQPPAPPRG